MRIFEIKTNDELKIALARAYQLWETEDAKELDELNALATLISDYEDKMLVENRKLSMNEVSKLFGIDKSDLRHTDTKLTEKIREVFYDALDYFGTRKGTTIWFKTVNRGLGSVTPLALLKDNDGIDRVRTSINKLRHGITA